MAKQVQLKAKPRIEAGKGPVKRLRATGVVPAIVYGAQDKPLNIGVIEDDLAEVLHHATGENVLVDLLVEEQGQSRNRLALIQEVQHHPVTDEILHVDFHEVSATEKLRTNVPVRAVGEPAGVKEGGVLEFIMRELHVECLPKDLPDVIEVDVTALSVGQSIHIKEVKPPSGVALLDDEDQTVFIVAAPVAEEETAPTEAAPGEPEVIGAKKEEGEEGGPVEGEAKKAEAGKPAGGKAAEPKPAAGKAPAGKTEAKK